MSSISNTSGSTWSLTVTSSDNTSLTYVVDSGTSIDGGDTGVSSIATGNMVTVLAVVTNGTAEAKQITDTSLLKANGQSWRPAPPNSSSVSSSSVSSSSGSVNCSLTVDGRQVVAHSSTAQDATVTCSGNAP